jgi:hypothetical protein
MWLGLKRPRIEIGFVLRLTSLHSRPRNALQNTLKDSIVVTQGLGPFSIQSIRNLLETRRINAVHFFKHKPCRTVVGLSRPSTSYFHDQGVDARGAGMTAEFDADS